MWHADGTGHQAPTASLHYPPLLPPPPPPSMPTCDGTQAMSAPYQGYSSDPTAYQQHGMPSAPYHGAPQSHWPTAMVVPDTSQPFQQFPSQGASRGRGFGRGQGDRGRGRGQGSSGRGQGGGGSRGQGGGGRGRGQPWQNKKGVPRPPNPMQNQTPMMPQGLSGPWQQQQQQLQPVVPAAPVAVTLPKPTGPILPKKPKPSIFDDKTAPLNVETAKRKLLEGLMNVKDDSYPKELLAKFSPLKCDLCVAKMNSTMQAKMHYNGKQHQKKVRLYMASKSQVASVGEAPRPKKPKLEANSTAAAATAAAPPAVIPPLPKSEPPPPPPPGTEKKEPPSLYCQYCDLSFTSALHAEQHYMGRNHQRVRQGQMPLKANFFNPATGKWQKKSLGKPIEDPTGRFGIGLNFVIEERAKSVDPRKGKFYCSACNVSATSQDQLELHFSGAKHRRNTETKQQQQQQQESAGPDPSEGAALHGSGFSVDAPSVEAAADTGKAGASGRDLSFFRTPSGKFYCQPCNLTLNSESQFVSHTESKKHKMRQASQKPAMVLTGPRAAHWGDKTSAPST